MKNMKKKGFTLVELVIVLVILAILVGVALPVFMGVRGRAYRAEALQIMSEAKTMAWGYNLQYGSPTAARWWSTGVGTLDPIHSPTIFGDIGYVTLPGTNNWDFQAQVRGNGVFTNPIPNGYGMVAPLIDCSGTGLCFVIEAQPRSGSAAASSGARRLSLVMNRTGSTVIIYE